MTPLPTRTQAGSPRQDAGIGEGDRARRPVEHGPAAPGLVGDRVEERERALVLARLTVKPAFQ